MFTEDSVVNVQGRGGTTNRKKYSDKVRASSRLHTGQHRRLLGGRNAESGGRHREGVNACVSDTKFEQ